MKSGGAKGAASKSKASKPQQQQQQRAADNSDDDDGDDDAMLMNLKDCRDLQLKPQHADRPIWVLPDGHIYLEASSPYYHQVRPVVYAGLGVRKHTCRINYGVG